MFAADGEGGGIGVDGHIGNGYAAVADVDAVVELRKTQVAQFAGIHKFRQGLHGREIQEIAVFQP